MYKVLTAFKMSEVLASVLKMYGPALKQSIILNYKISKLESGIFQILFNSWSREIESQDQNSFPS